MAPYFSDNDNIQHLHLEYYRCTQQNTRVGKFADETENAHYMGMVITNAFG